MQLVSLALATAAVKIAAEALATQVVLFHFCISLPKSRPINACIFLHEWLGFGIDQKNMTVASSKFMLPVVSVGLGIPFVTVTTLRAHMEKGNMALPVRQKECD